MRWKKSLNSAAAPCAAGRDVELGEIAGLEADLRQRRHRRAELLGRRRQRIGVAAHGVGLQVEGVDLGQPGALVGREHACRADRSGSAARRARRRPGPCACGRRCLHSASAPSTLASRASASGSSSRFAYTACTSSACASGAISSSATAWRTISPPPSARSSASSPTSDSRMNSTRRSAPRQRVEDRAVEDERADHLPAIAQRVVERRVVVHPQVAAEPHQALRVDLVDGQ